MFDYSGYTTKYESSNHIGAVSQRYSPVIGYEGPFFPPAVADLIEAKKSDESFARALASIENAIVIDDSSYLDILKSSMTADLSSMIEFTRNYDEKTSEVTSYTYLRDKSVH